MKIICENQTQTQLRSEFKCAQLNVPPLSIGIIKTLGMVIQIKLYSSDENIKSYVENVLKGERFKCERIVRTLYMDNAE